MLCCMMYKGIDMRLNTLFYSMFHSVQLEIAVVVVVVVELPWFLCIYSFSSSASHISFICLSFHSIRSFARSLKNLHLNVDLFVNR